MFLGSRSINTYLFSYVRASQCEVGPENREWKERGDLMVERDCVGKMDSKEETVCHFIKSLRFKLIIVLGVKCSV